MTDAEIVIVLKKARALIKKGWCKGSFATDKSGGWVQTVLEMFDRAAKSS